MAIVYRQNKGSKLTTAEVDANFKWVAEAGASSSNTVFLNRPAGWIHGAWDAPITGNLTIDITGALPGGCAVVIWSGSSNPIITGAVVAERTGNITVQGTYAIYIMMINGKVVINTPLAENGGVPPDPGGVSFTAPAITVTDPTISFTTPAITVTDPTISFTAPAITVTD